MRGFAADHHFGVDPALNRIRLLALSEVADSRIAVAAWYDEEFATVVLSRTPVGNRPGEPTVGPQGTGGGRTGTGKRPGRDGRVLVTALMEPPAGFDGPGLDADTRAFWQAGAVYYAGRKPNSGERMPDKGPARVIPTSFATATAASTDLVAVRLPMRDAEPVLSGQILVVAPPSATKLLVDGPGTGSLPLTGGVGVLPAPGPLASQTVTAVDDRGNVVATARYSEPDTTGQFFGERVVDNWG